MTGLHLLQVNGAQDVFPSRQKCMCPCAPFCSHSRRRHIPHIILPPLLSPQASPGDHASTSHLHLYYDSYGTHSLISQHLSLDYWLLMGIYNSSKPLLTQIITLWGTFICVFVHTWGFISRINFLKWNWKGKECMHFYFTYCLQRGCNDINFY